MKINVAFHEGGLWRGPVEVTVKDAIELMEPGCKIAAIMFSNGVIYDNILASKHYSPIHGYSKARRREFTPKPLS